MTVSAKSYFGIYTQLATRLDLNFDSTGIKTATRRYWAHPVEIMGIVFEASLTADTAQARITQLAGMGTSVGIVPSETFDVFGFGDTEELGFGMITPMPVIPGQSVAFEVVTADVGEALQCYYLYRAFPQQVKANDRTAYTSGPYTAGGKTTSREIPGTPLSDRPYALLEQVESV